MGKLLKAAVHGKKVSKSLETKIIKNIDCVTLLCDGYLKEPARFESLLHPKIVVAGKELLEEIINSLNKYLLRRVFV